MSQEILDAASQLFSADLAICLAAEFMTVICLDDYHSLDRKQRKAAGGNRPEPQSQQF